MRRLYIVLVGGLLPLRRRFFGQTPQAPIFRGGVTLVIVDVYRA